MSASSRKSSAVPEPHPALNHQPMQMLVRIARQSGLGNPEGCVTVLSLLATSKLLRAHFQRLLARLDLTEVKFSTLVTLYAVDPEPSTPADLAVQAQISRAAMTDALDSLRAKGWIQRERGQNDRRTLHIHLTAAGRDLIERAVRPFLVAVGHCAEALTVGEQAALAGACAHLCAHFQTETN